MTLAAIQLLIQFGKVQDVAYQNLQKSIEKFIPLDKVSQYPTITWVQKVMEIYSTMNPISKIEAKLCYLDHVKNNSLYESHQFNVNVTKLNLFNIKFI
jgi:hypothetical protein